MNYIRSFLNGMRKDCNWMRAEHGKEMPKSMMEESVKLVNIIRVLLQGVKYDRRETDSTIVLYDGYPEDYILIEKAPGADRFMVFEVHRNDKRFRAEGEQEEAAVFAAVLYKRWCDEIDRVKAKTLRDYVNSGEEEKALALIREWFDERCYTIGTEDPARISFLPSGDLADVKFGGEFIVQGASLARAYVVLYNYCEKLRNITTFCDELQSGTDREKILRLYILS